MVAAMKLGPLYGDLVDVVVSFGQILVAATVPKRCGSDLQHVDLRYGTQVLRFKGSV